MKVFNGFILTPDAAITSNNLWSFILQHGLTGKEITALSIGVLLVALGICVAWHSSHALRKELIIGSIVPPLNTLLIGLAFRLLA